MENNNALNASGSQEKKHTYLRRLLTVSALILAILFIILGILRSEQETIFIKAIRICAECIGLG